MQGVSTGEIERILQKAIEDLWIPYFLEKGMDASGQWKAKAEAKGNSIWGMDYTEQLVYGRKPGNMPPVQPLIEWAKAKFGVGDNEARSIAWGTARKIAKEGTTWYQEGGTDLLEFLESQMFVDFVNDELKKTVGENMKREYLREIKKTFNR